MAKQLMFDDTARAQLKDGLSQLAEAVKVTLGPTGRNVILHKSWGSPKVTKDGVSVSKEIELPEPFDGPGRGDLHPRPKARDCRRKSDGRSAWNQ